MIGSFYLRQVLGWGLALWFIGYLLGFIFYTFVPAALVGWYVMPLVLAITCGLLWKWICLDSLQDTIFLGAGWSVIAEVCDRLFIVKLLNPADSYRQLGVYLYYLLTLLLPLIIRNVKGAR